MEPFMVNYSQSDITRLFLPKPGGKYTLDVNLAIRLSLEALRRAPGQNI